MQEQVPNPVIFSIPEITSNNPLVYQPPPHNEIWLSEPERQASCHEIEECQVIAEYCEQVKWINKTPDNPSDPLPNLIGQSDNNSETSHFPPPVFVPEGGNGAAQPDVDDESIVPLNAPEGAPSNIPLVDLDDAQVASDDASVPDSISRF